MQQDHAQRDRGGQTDRFVEQWLRASLGASFDSTLYECLPQEFLAMLREPPSR